MPARHLFAAIWVTCCLLSQVVAAEPGRWGSKLAETNMPDWKAQWIWLPNDSEADMLLARKAFYLPEAPERALLSITATSQYQLFVNGEYVCGGPARCAAHHQSFDVLDISDRLRRGANVVAVRVHFQREGMSYYGPSRAGLLAQVDCTSGMQETTFPTDAGWRVTSDDSWLNTSPRMARFHLEVCDRVDMRRGIRGWTDLDFDDAKWQSAQVLRREEGWPLPGPDDRPTHLVPPWTSLVPRDIPYLKESISTARPPIHVGSLPEPQDESSFLGDLWADAPVIPRIPVKRQDTLQDGPLTIAANEPGNSRVLVYDLGEVQNGKPFLDVMGPRGAVVDIISVPYLIDGSVRSPIVASTYVDRVVLSGQRDRWEAFYMKPTRYLAVVFRHLPKDAQVFGAGLRRLEYPFQRNGSFHTPDAPELDALWEAAAKTIEVCTTDAYTDNYRERRQYAQTAYYACLGAYAVHGDTALQRRYLKQIAEEQLPNGIMPAYAPRHGDDFMVILDSNCFWIRGLHQYLLYSGDAEIVRELLPSARKLLGLLDGYTNEDGLIDSPPYPYWLDHALNDRRGANVCLNGHYLGALEDFAQVLQWLDEPDAAIYRQRATRVRQTLRDKAWDPDRQLFADAIIDGRRSQQFSEHANAMAMALRIATPEQMSAIAGQLSKTEEHDFARRADGVVMVTPAMSYFLHAGLCEAGYADESWDLLRSRFARMLQPNGNGTLWEEWWLDGTGRSGTFRPIASGRSDAQTESAFFPGLFARYILGIEPTQPGLGEVVVRYYPCDRLSRRRGAIPTPSGVLGVAWNIAPSEIEISLKTPKNTTVRVDLGSLKAPSADHILLDDKPVSPQQCRDGFLLVSEGDHVVRVKRMGSPPQKDF